MIDMVCFCAQKDINLIVYESKTRYSLIFDGMRKYDKMK